jgi:small-conductance mechanosensitive channel
MGLCLGWLKGQAMGSQIVIWFEHVVGVSPELPLKLFNTILVLFVFWLLYRSGTSVIRRRIEEMRPRYLWQKGVEYSLLFILIVWISQIWIGGFQNAATFWGLLSAGLAIALRELVVNILGWFYIMMEHPFRVGDRIQIGEVAGDVVDQSAFHFSLLDIGNWVRADQSTGRVVFVPNSKVFSDPVFSYERGLHFIWNEIAVSLTLESDWRQAKELLQAIADRHAGQLADVAQKNVQEASGRFMIYYANLTPTVYISIAENSIVLTLRYLCEPRQRRITENAIWQDILTELKDQPQIHLIGDSK